MAAVTLTSEQREALDRILTLDFDSDDSGEIGRYAANGDFARAEAVALSYVALVRLLAILDDLPEDRSECELVLSDEDFLAAGQYLLDRTKRELEFHGRWMRGEAPDWMGRFEAQSEDGQALDDNIDTHSTAVALLEAAGESSGREAAGA